MLPHKRTEIATKRTLREINSTHRHRNIVALKTKYRSKFACTEVIVDPKIAGDIGLSFEYCDGRAFDDVTPPLAPIESLSSSSPVEVVGSAVFSFTKKEACAASAHVPGKKKWCN